jgi:hypothetical protein
MLRGLTPRKGNLMTDLTDLTRFTSGSVAGRQQRLPGPLRDLHHAVLRRFLATGAPPTARWVRQAGEQWVAGHPGTFLLTLGEAADLAARRNRRMFPDALGAR